jgi:hypothetical protein
VVAADPVVDVVDPRGSRDGKRITTLGDVDRAKLPSPLVSVAEQMAVDGLQMCQVEAARERPLRELVLYCRLHLLSYRRRANAAGRLELLGAFRPTFLARSSRRPARQTRRGKARGGLTYFVATAGVFEGRLPGSAGWMYFVQVKKYRVARARQRFAEVLALPKEARTSSSSGEAYPSRFDRSLLRATESGHLGSRSSTPQWRPGAVSPTSWWSTATLGATSTTFRRSSRCGTAAVASPDEPKNFVRRARRGVVGRGRAAPPTGYKFASTSRAPFFSVPPISKLVDAIQLRS